VAALQEFLQLKQQVWECLQRIRPNGMIGAGRVYGGGLHKLEPTEPGRVPSACRAAAGTGVVTRAEAAGAVRYSVCIAVMPTVRGGVGRARSSHPRDLQREG